MPFSRPDRNFYKPYTNPVLETADLTKPMLTSDDHYSLPRHIPQSSLSQIRGDVNETIRAHATSAKVSQDQLLNPYSLEDNLTLCPTLNFYQSSSQPLNETAQLHLQNIRQNLERRIESAKEAGNESLVRVLELECQSLAL